MLGKKGKGREGSGNGRPRDAGTSTYGRVQGSRWCRSGRGGGKEEKERGGEMGTSSDHYHVLSNCPMFSALSGREGKEGGGGEGEK